MVRFDDVKDMSTEYLNSNTFSVDIYLTSIELVMRLMLRH